MYGCVRCRKGETVAIAMSLAPRNAATDEEDSNVDARSEDGSTGSETSEKKASAKGEALVGHAVDIGDSPLASEDDSSALEPAADPLEEAVQQPADEQVEQEDTGPKEKQPYDVPVVGDFYMHDDRSTTVVKTPTAPRLGIEEMCEI